jgi:ribosomal protein L37AE/L43A
MTIKKKNNNLPIILIMDKHFGPERVINAPPGYEVQVLTEDYEDFSHSGIVEFEGSTYGLKIFTNYEDINDTFAFKSTCPECYTCVDEKEATLVFDQISNRISIQYECPECKSTFEYVFSLLGSRTIKK